eukprot:COSAG01_NODE_49021_length_375_cov_9.293478_1_plen_60_part_01
MHLRCSMLIPTHNQNSGSTEMHLRCSILIPTPMTWSRYAGVQGVPGEEGELFGMRNLFTL